MVLDKNISPLIVFKEDDLSVALQKMSANKSGILFCITERGVLDGVLTDGDVRRWLVRQKTVDLRVSVREIANKSFVFAKSSQTSSEIFQLFDQKKKITFVPVVDEFFHLVAVARMDDPGFLIAEKKVDQSSPCFIIAEIGNNHNGDIVLAKRLVDLAKEAGADCAKFQMRDMDSLYANKGNSMDASEDLGSQYVLDLLERFQLSTEEMFEVFDHCKKVGIIPLCTPWDVASLRRLDEYGLPGFKIASADLTNHDLLLEVAKTGKPMLVSTGMSTESEIEQTVDVLRGAGANFCLLHCNSAYPAPFKDVNLKYIERLRQIGGGIVGYSGHERGIAVAIAAVSMGAKVIEKHFTIDKKMEGNDHKVSLLPAEFKEMVQGIRAVEESLGSDKRMMSQGELINRETLAKSLCLSRAVRKGEIFKSDMLEVKSPGKGLQPNRKLDVIGKTAKRDYREGEILYQADIVDNVVEARNFSFPYRWGIPVRYHDFKRIMEKSNPELLEFHLSFKDLDEDLSTHFGNSRYLGTTLVVHAPELFRGDHILNLVADDDSYRAHSVRELQRVIDVTRSLQKYFAPGKTCIVTNIGGYDVKGFWDEPQRARAYEKLRISLSQLDTKGVEIIPQTMPPFPWHFGGQSHHNLFVSPEEIASFCKVNGARICFDISHSVLACNHYGWSLARFVEQVGPYVAHMHIADAKGVDGEGLQIDDGEMNFVDMFKMLLRDVPSSAMFIPEVWQGHKNEGEGFWFALDRLERYCREAK